MSTRASNFQFFVIFFKIESKQEIAQYKSVKTLYVTTTRLKRCSDHLWPPSVTTICDHHLWPPSVTTICDHHLWPPSVTTICDHHLWTTICGPPSVDHHLWTTICGPPSVDHHLWTTICGPPRRIYMLINTNHNLMSTKYSMPKKNKIIPAYSRHFLDK